MSDLITWILVWPDGEMVKRTRATSATDALKQHYRNLDQFGGDHSEDYELTIMAYNVGPGLPADLTDACDERIAQEIPRHAQSVETLVASVKNGGWAVRSSTNQAEVAACSSLF